MEKKLAVSVGMQPVVLPFSMQTQLSREVVSGWVFYFAVSFYP